MNVDDLPIAVAVIGADRRVVSVNPAMAELLGAEPATLAGRTINEAFRPRRASGEDILSNDWHPSAYLRGVKRLNEQEVVVRRADGTEIEVLVDGGYERDAAGGLTGATILMRRRTSGPRRPRSGVRIVSAVSHELRSPLTSVRGYTSLLLKRWDDIGDADRRLMLQQIDHDARRISRMIGELLDITRLETGKVQLNRVDLDIVPIVRDVFAKVEMSWPDFQAEMQFPTNFPHIDADPDKIEQVLTNLVENACKYASPQGIRVIGSVQEDKVTIEVVDCGPGIPEADLPQLFQQFFKSREGRPTGTGLGLWISRGLIESHGGEMTATSRVNEGTTFRFTLPRFFETPISKSAPFDYESTRPRQVTPT